MLACPAFRVHPGADYIGDGEVLRPDIRNLALAAGAVIGEFQPFSLQHAAAVSTQPDHLFSSTPEIPVAADLRSASSAHHGSVLLGHIWVGDSGASAGITSKFVQHACLFLEMCHAKASA